MSLFYIIMKNKLICFFPLCLPKNEKTKKIRKVGKNTHWESVEPDTLSTSCIYDKDEPLHHLDGTHDKSLLTLK